MADTLVIPACGLIAQAQFVLGLDAAEDILLKLFTNNVDFETDAPALVVGDFTEMTSGEDSGYSAITLSMSSWDTPTENASDQAEADYDSAAAQTYTFTGTGTGATVYGYYCVMATTGTLLWACKFANAKAIANAGETITIYPTFKYGDNS